MSTPNPAAEAARENVRTATGQFGNQQHSSPDADFEGNYPSSEARQSTMVQITEGDWRGDNWVELDQYEVDARAVFDAQTIGNLPADEHDIFNGDEGRFIEAGVIRRPDRSFSADIVDEEAYDEYVRQRETGERPGFVHPYDKYGVPEGRGLFENTTVDVDTVDVDSGEIEAMCDNVLDAETDRDRQQAQAELRAWADLSGQLGYHCDLPAEGDFTREQVDNARGQITRATERFDGHPLLGVGNSDAIESWARDEAAAEGVLDDEAISEIDSYMDWHRYGVNRLEARTDTVTLGGSEYYAFTNE